SAGLSAKRVARVDPTITPILGLDIPVSYEALVSEGYLNYIGYWRDAPQGGTFLKPRHVHRSEDCRAVSDILQRVGDKWTVLVVGKLGEGPLRFNELR